ncbi:MAG: hypothetical protein HN952_08485 [Candidatus Cloacimonetes bacterium]|jgi:hypothetical protein|nr:hypothetical protein [Candidatus Cloacimonadota bacterium]
MKKTLLVLVSLLVVGSLFAVIEGEAYVSFPLVGYADAVDEDGGLVKGYVGIGIWGDDYGFHYDFDDNSINHMYKTFTLHKFVNLTVGKTTVPLVKQGSLSGFANINIVDKDYINGTDWILNWNGEFKGLGWQLYTVNNNDSALETWDYADTGLRLDYNLMGADLGFGYQMIGVPEDADAINYWAFDLGYTVMEKINLKLQLLNEDDLNDDTDDLDYSVVVEYVPGFKGVTPYFGYITYFEMLAAEEANVMFFGFNLNPTEDSVLKLEYKMYSAEYLIGEDDYLTDTLVLDLGFKF